MFICFQILPSGSISFSVAGSFKLGLKAEVARTPHGFPAHIMDARRPARLPAQTKVREMALRMLETHYLPATHPVRVSRRASFRSKPSSSPDDSDCSEGAPEDDVLDDDDSEDDVFQKARSRRRHGATGISPSDPAGPGFFKSSGPTVDPVFDVRWNIIADFENNGVTNFSCVEIVRFLVEEFGYRLKTGLRGDVKHQTPLQNFRGDSLEIFFHLLAATIGDPVCAQVETAMCQKDAAAATGSSAGGADQPFLCCNKQ